HGANQNETAQLAGHFLLGATLAYINGGDPLSGGSAAVAAEKAAQYLSQQYHDGKTAIDPQTGRFNPNLLPEQIKEDIKAAAGVIASIVGATGDNGAALNAQIGGVLGQNAVENNTALARYQNRVNLHENIADVTDPFGILTPLYNIKNALGDLNKLKDESRRKDQDKINQNIQEYLQKHGIKIHLNTAYEEVNGQGVTRLDTEGNRKVLTKALQEFAQASATTHATFRAEKMRLGIPTTMQPTAVRRVPLMEKDYFTGKDRQKTDSIRQPIFATEYLFIINGKNYVIQNHSAGHDFGELSGRGNQAAHFNSKQLELTTYTVSGKVNADVWKQEKDMPHNRQTYTPSKITGVTEHRYTKPSVNAKPSESFFKKPFLKRK
ncbi:HNH/endonuclease VII fold putative polymorphic toxin, partial [Neisseria musculi]